MRELARGGMGRVDVALRVEGGFRRLVAIKRLLPVYRDDAGFREMFLEEARIAGLLRHPNIVSVSDLGVDEDGPYLVMDFVEGPSLAAVVRHAARRSALLPIQFCLRVARAVARGLHAAHELRGTDGTPLGLVHRDITPQNILLSYDGEVRVADFGIAKALGRGSKTETGVLKGKLSYMSPEQLRFREPDRRSDLFALGIVLFEMLSTERLYAAEGRRSARRILDEPPPDILDFRDDVPAPLVELLFDLLAKDPEQRPSSAEACERRLDDLLEDLLTVEEPLSVTDYLAEHLSEQRATASAELAEAVRAAEAATLPEESLPVASAADAGSPPRFTMTRWLATGAALALLAGGSVALWGALREAAPGAPAGTVEASAAPPPRGAERTTSAADSSAVDSPSAPPPDSSPESRPAATTSRTIPSTPSDSSASSGSRPSPPVRRRGTRRRGDRRQSGAATAPQAAPAPPLWMEYDE